MRGTVKETSKAQAAESEDKHYRKFKTALLF